VQNSRYYASSNSAYASSYDIVITYDENGGRFDHVAPPTGDSWGPGTRVPAIFISPFAKRGFVDHTPMETDSILKTIEAVNHLQPVGTHDADPAVNNTLSAYTFSATDVLRMNRVRLR
jgi:phospholipase C